MTYVINWTKTGSAPDGKPVIMLPPLSVDSTSTSLTLTGKGTPNYGEIQQENFIRLLENFASDTAPPNATAGQIWFNTSDHSLYFLDNDGEWKRVGGIFKDTTSPVGTYPGDLWWDTDDNKLFVYDGTEWGQIWPSLSAIPIAFVDEYNDWADRYNKIAGTPSTHQTPTSSRIVASVNFDGEIVHNVKPFNSVIPNVSYGDKYGYNQSLVPHETAETLTNAKWISLLAKFRNLANHQATDASKLSTTGFILEKDATRGVAVVLDEYNMSLPVIEAIELNRFNVNPLSLESAVLPNSSYTRTASYYNAKFFSVAFTFNNIDHARGFFNGGGKLKINFAFSPSQSTPFSNSWRSFITSLDHLVYSAKNVVVSGAETSTAGFHSLALGGAYSTVSNNVSTVAGSIGAYIKTQARLESVANSTSVILRFNIEFAPDGITDVNNVYDSSNSAAIGNTVVGFTTFKPNEMHLNSNEIPYPTATQGGTFVTDTTV